MRRASSATRRGRRGVHGAEISFVIGREHETSGGRQHPASERKHPRRRQRRCRQSPISSRPTLRRSRAARGSCRSPLTRCGPRPIVIVTLSGGGGARRARRVDGARLACRDEEQAASRIVGRRRKVRRTAVIGHAGLGRTEIVRHDRPPVGANARSPTWSARTDGRAALFPSRDRARRTSRCDWPAMTTFVRPLLQRHGREHWHLCRIPVVQIVRRELIVPAQLAGVGVERHERACIEVVALAVLSVVRGIRIARAVEHEIQLGIVAAGHPDTAAALRHRVR